jgi:hypothetical protein
MWTTTVEISMLIHCAYTFNILYKSICRQGTNYHLLEMLSFLNEFLFHLTQDGHHSNF